MSSRTSLPAAQVFFFKFSRVRKVIADRAVFGNWKPSGAREIVRWLMTWLEPSRYGSVVDNLRPLCRVDPDVNRHEQRWVRIHDVRGQRDTDLGWSMVGLETMKGALGATTLFVRRPHARNQRGEHGGQREWSLPASRDDNGREVTVSTNCATLPAPTHL